MCACVHLSTQKQVKTKKKRSSRPQAVVCAETFKNFHVFIVHNAKKQGRAKKFERGGAIFDVQITARNQVKTKKRKYKKVFTSFDVQITARNQVKTKKENKKRSLLLSTSYISVGEPRPQRPPLDTPLKRKTFGHFLASSEDNFFCQKEGHVL